MRTAAHYRSLMRRNPRAQVGCSLAAAAVYAAAHGICAAEQHGEIEDPFGWVERIDHLKIEELAAWRG